MMESPKNLPLPLESVQTFWDALGWRDDELKLSRKGTLYRTQPDDSKTPPLPDDLPLLRLDSDTELSDTPDLHLQEELGSGGMGVILKAEQLPLKREVAVKRLHSGRDTTFERHTLLREAWVTGALEHPNIVPVHQLGVDEHGSPLLVMKRIEGVSWSEVMHNPEHPLRQGREEDQLAWNLDVLMQVCNAVHFAHSRGILHRDLKPENVMIGSFGEVYLLDWGIALSLHEEPQLPIPTTRSLQQAIGTPAYMAPEMIHLGVPLSERTDVYLLGGLLHEILRGRPPHSGKDLHELLYNAVLSPPKKYKARIPQSLVSIVHKAMHARPGERFSTADDLRHEIAEFLLHRESIRLTERGLESLHHLQLLLIENEEDDAQDSRLRIHQLFTEVRFAFQQALQSWPDNPGALEGLERAHLHMTWFAIEEKDEKAADLHLHSLSNPPPSLLEAWETFQKEQDTRKLEWKNYARQKFNNDLKVGGRTRSFLVLLLGGLTAPLSLVFGQSLGFFNFGYSSHLLFGGGFLALTLFFSIWARETMTRTEINRKILGTLWLQSAMLLVLPLVSWKMGLPAKTSFTFSALLLALYVGIAAMILDWRLLSAAGMFLLTFVAGAWWPKWLFEWYAGGCLVAVLLIAWFWQPETWFRYSEKDKAQLQQWREEEKQRSFNKQHS